MVRAKWLISSSLQHLIYTTIRGWQDWLNWCNDGSRLLRFDILCSDLCIYTTLGYWWCARNCGFNDGSKVRFLFQRCAYTDWIYFSVLEINWNYMGDAIPAFLTLIIIPLTYKFVFPICTKILDRYCDMQHCVWRHCRDHILRHS